MSGEKTEVTRKKIVFEELEEYRRDIGIVEHEIDSFKEKVRDLNRELGQLSKYMELPEEIRSTIRKSDLEYNIPKEGYRRNEQPTGEEVNRIVKFWYGVTAEQYKHINSMLKDERRKNRKAAAALAATSTAALGLLIKLVCFSDNQ